MRGAPGRRRRCCSCCRFCVGAVATTLSFPLEKQPEETCQCLRTLCSACLCLRQPFFAGMREPEPLAARPTTAPRNRLARPLVNWWPSHLAAARCCKRELVTTTLRFFARLLARSHSCSALPSEPVPVSLSPSLRLSPSLPPSLSLSSTP